MPVVANAVLNAAINELGSPTTATTVSCPKPTPLDTPV
jgi:hypothetical protein